MNKKQRLAGFDALLESRRNSSHYYEESDGSWRQWHELSAEGKTGYIASDAALYDVPFERFAQAVRDAVGEQPALVREDAYLRLALSNQRELHELERLLPPDHTGTESVPLLARFKEVLDWHARRACGGFDWAYDALFVRDGPRPAKTRLEFFGDEFERLAKSPRQKQMASQFKQFVGEITDLGGKEAFQRLLTYRAKPAATSPERDRDKGIER